MIPAPFEYVRAGSVDEAITALTEHGDDAKLRGEAPPDFEAEQADAGQAGDRA